MGGEGVKTITSRVHPDFSQGGFKPQMPNAIVFEEQKLSRVETEDEDHGWRNSGNYAMIAPL